MKSGAKPLLTPEIQKRIVKALRLGNTVETAATYGGIDRVTYWRYMKRGEVAKRGPYRAFFLACTAARQAAIKRNVEIVQQAARGVDVLTTRTKTYTNKDGVEVTEVVETRTKQFDWRASQWWLEKFDRGTFGPPPKEEGGGGPTPTPTGTARELAQEIMEALNEIDRVTDTNDDVAPATPAN